MDSQKTVGMINEHKGIMMNTWIEAIREAEIQQDSVQAMNGRIRLGRILEEAGFEWKYIKDIKHAEKAWCEE